MFKRHSKEPECLASNKPRATLRVKAGEIQQTHPVLVSILRLFGAHSQERAWRCGAEGEEEVAGDSASWAKNGAYCTPCRSAPARRTSTTSSSDRRGLHAHHEEPPRQARHRLRKGDLRQPIEAVLPHEVEGRRQAGDEAPEQRVQVSGGGEADVRHHGQRVELQGQADCCPRRCPKSSFELAQ